MSNEYDLPVWERPDYYMGYSPDGEYVIYARHRDSSIMENLNYEKILEKLQDMDQEGDQVYDFRASHWAVGWVEYIMIKPTAPGHIQAEAAGMIGALADYPILDEEAYSAAQSEARFEYWQNLGLQCRIEECREAGVSIFAARRDDDIPEAVETRMEEWECFQ